MPHQSEKLAVMFADICDSTGLYDRLGDGGARQLIAKYIDLMMSVVIAHHGKLIKTIGDEIMCTFPGADMAMNAACDMQRRVEGRNGNAEHPIHIRIGFHYGEVICEENDVYGDTVNVAARIASITRASQIMTTLGGVRALPNELTAKTQQIQRAELKGKQEQFELFRVSWEDDDLDRTRIGMPTQRNPAFGGSELILRYRDQVFKVGEEHKTAIIGRVASCEIHVDNDFASRQHARIEYRFGKFVIKDQSTNGTSVRFSDGHLVFLSHEDLILHRSGLISLGRPEQGKSIDNVEFTISHPGSSVTEDQI